MSYPDPSAENYLESTVRTAPPARLRLMLIERAVGLCQTIASNWKAAPQSRKWDERSLQLSDILTELLSGVGRTDIAVAKTVADLYVFLIQHLNKAVESGDGSMIDELCVVLETEAETWRMVCAQTSVGSPNVAGLTTPAASIAASPRKPFEPLRPEDRAGLSGSLNLQG
jgi:flagellar secretion chaperone FliS